MIDIMRGLSRIAEEGVENDDNDESGQKLRSTTRAARCVSGVIDK